MRIRSSYRADRTHAEPRGERLVFIAGAIIFFAVLVGGRLFTLMVLHHDRYVALAADSQELYEKFFPVRGQIYFQDSRTAEEYPAAISRDVFGLFVDSRQILNDKMADEVTKELTDIFHYDEAKAKVVRDKLNRRTDPYEPLEKRVDEQTAEIIKEKHLPGIGLARYSERYYPEKTLGAHVLGFVGKDQNGNSAGRYGIEGYWQDTLSGSGGYLSGTKSPGGRLIPLAESDIQPAKNGANLLLTIDRTLQFRACERLRQAAAEYQAVSASLVVLNPLTGAILAMCSFPDFDPNTYNDVADIGQYNNTAIFTAYEPGSVFKPVGMAGALNEGIVNSDTVFHDVGSRAGLCSKPIQNALFKSYGDQTMTGVLVHSINTGMVFVAEHLGKRKFQDYVERFGFGVKEGLEIDKEVAGTVESLSKNKGSQLDCYTATASFGQG
ncbi:MAG: penicillin-binding protein 2, partial [Candidatus Magasanikbacteria bacterium]|nr:penicillin-binding protein 2 [Candidatus Magasanikbacteria bacterium]